MNKVRFVLFVKHVLIYNLFNEIHLDFKAQTCIVMRGYGFTLCIRIKVQNFMGQCTAL